MSDLILKTIGLGLAGLAGAAAVDFFSSVCTNSIESHLCCCNSCVSKEKIERYNEGLISLSPSSDSRVESAAKEALVFKQSRAAYCSQRVFKPLSYLAATVGVPLILYYPTAGAILTAVSLIVDLFSNVINGCYSEAIPDIELNLRSSAH
jgi:hypothetical protein